MVVNCGDHRMRVLTMNIQEDLNRLPLSYDGTDVEIRDDLRDAHARLFDYVRRPGAWLSGAERIAVAEEARQALECALCASRKEALSPDHVSGSHDRVTDLPENWVDLIHRIRTDSGRLSKAWFDRVIASGISVETYVEIVGIVTLTTGADMFCRALGIDRFTLPESMAGEPTSQRPQGLREGVAWVPMLFPEDASGPEEDLYGTMDSVPNIGKALSLVPDHVRMLLFFSRSHYMDFEEIADPTVARDLDRMQIELIAARVSSLNQCFY